MAFVLNQSRLRVTTANLYGNPGGTGVTQITEGTGLTFAPDPITSAGSIALTVPVTVPHGGSGAITLTGYLKGTGVTPFTAAATIPTTDITGTLGVDHGGTGLASVGAGLIPFGTGITPLGTDAALSWDNTEKRLTVSKSVGATGVFSRGIDSTLTASAADANDRNSFYSQINDTNTVGATAQLINYNSQMSLTGNGGITTSGINFLAQATNGVGHNLQARSGVYVADAVNTGTLTTQYGVNIAPLVAGSSGNFSVYTAGTTPSQFGGMVTSLTAFRGPIQDKGGRVISVDAYGAVPDGVLNDSASVTVGTPNLTLGSVGASDGFSTSDVGKTIAIAGAGASGGVLTTTVAAVPGAGAEGQKTSCTLNTVALTECIEGRAIWGTDNKTFIQNAINANQDRQEGHTIELSTGNYLVTGEMSFTNEQTSFVGQGKGSSRLFQISTTANTLNVPFTAANMEFRGFSIWGMGAKCTGGYAIGFASGFGPYFQCFVSNVQIKDVYTAFYCDWAGANGMTFDNTQVIGTSGDSFRWDGGVEATTVLVYQYVEQASMSIGVGTDDLTLHPGPGLKSFFSSRDVGKKVGVYGAGGSATTPLIGTITEVTAATTGTISVVATSTAVAQSATVEYPASAGWHMMNGSPVFRDVHFIGGDYGLHINPDTGDNVSWMFADVLDCDSNRIYGLYVAPTGSGTVQMYQINNSWFSSSASGGWAGRSEVTAGIKFVGQVGTPINGMSFSDCTIGHNSKYGVHSTFCHNLNFDASTFDTNSTLLANTYDHVNVDNCGVFSLKNSSLGSRYSTLNGGAPVNVRYGLVMSANVLGHITVLGNSFTQFGTGAMSDSSTSATKMVKDNPGLNPMAITTPGVPASTVTYSNAFGSDAAVYLLTDGATTISAISINGTVTGATLPISSQKTLNVPAGGTIAMTYAGGTPTWTWIGS